jgi:EAL domain-containing protein (putative c-di-GMP-specific phosphodiesterase class I)
LVAEVGRALRDSGLPPERLKLEIVETALMNEADGTMAILHGFRDLGVKLAIDDFGTGYSSLSYLQKFPVDTLKIDRSFLRGARPRSREHDIIRSIVSLAHALDIDVTAEGVETPEQLSVLVSSGCDRAQGYLFARPLPEEAVASFMAAQQRPDVARAS